ncbi:hypothetical protein Hanom_Chr10g00927611 [Helianthus anomalus]
MILEDKVKNLPKVDADELVLDHMDAKTLKRLNVYQGVDEDKEPPYRKPFAAILKYDYVAPHFDKWRHDDSNLDLETKKMEDQKKRVVSPKAAKSKPAAKRVSKKKSPPRLVDKPIDLPPENVDVIVTSEPVSDYLNVQGSMSFDDLENIIAGESPKRATQLVKEKVAKVVAQAAKNVEAATGGEALKETIDEGEVHTDSNETASDIEITKMTPTSYVSGKFKLNGGIKEK